MWFDFALSANWRGRCLANALNVPMAKGGQRYLDIGAGFGGMLVAFNELGYDVLGVELDPIRVGLARENLKSLRGNPSIEAGDILDSASVGAIGKFDWITCIDVIEHVASVEQALSNAVSLLNPGGTLVLEIPNKDAIKFVNQDGHFALYGITQLPRWAAIDYHSENYGFRYDVGDYYPLEFYTGLLNKLGTEVVSMFSPIQPELSREDVLAEAKKFIAQDIESLVNALDNCPSLVKPYLVANLSAYQKQCSVAVNNVTHNKESADSFLSRYGATFWMVKATKK